MEPWHEPHPLQSVRLKIGRAEQHLKAIDGYVDKYKAAAPYNIVYNLNSEKTFQEGRLYAKFPPFLEFGIAVGEFAYQLRSALDNLVYALARPNFPGSFGSRERERAEKSTMFPILLVENRDAILGRIAHVASATKDAVFEAIDKHQPYKNGNRAEYHVLSVLEEINIRDKHRVINAATANITIQTDNIPEGVELRQGSVDNREVVVRIPAHLNAEADFHPRFSFQIILPVGRPAGGVSIYALRPIHEYVRDKVMPDFTGFFPPEP